MIRRGSMSLLAVALGLFGLAPLSLCATMANLPTNCVPTPHCEGMDSEQTDAVMASQTIDCCQANNAPVPQSKVEMAAPSVSLDSAIASFSPVPTTEMVESALTSRARSAPFDPQASLCVFLI